MVSFSANMEPPDDGTTRRPHCDGRDDLPRHRLARRHDDNSMPPSSCGTALHLHCDDRDDLPHHRLARRHDDISMLPSSCYAAPHPLRAARAACDDVSACATLQHPMHATLSSAPALQGIEPTPHAPGLQSTSLTLFTTSFPNNRHHAPPAAATKMLDLSTQLQQPEWAAPRAERVDDCPRAKAGLLAPHNVTLPPQHAARRRDPGKLLLERANGGGCDVLSNGPRTAPTIYSLCRIGAMMAASMLLVLSCCPARAQPVPSSYSARAQLVHSPCPAHAQSVLSLCSACAQLVLSSARASPTPLTGSVRHLRRTKEVRQTNLRIWLAVELQPPELLVASRTRHFAGTASDGATPRTATRHAPPHA